MMCLEEKNVQTERVLRNKTRHCRNSLVLWEVLWEGEHRSHQSDRLRPLVARKQQRRRLEQPTFGSTFNEKMPRY